MPPPTPGMVQRPKFAGLKSRAQAPFQTVDLGGTPTSSRASDATASPLTQPPPKAAAAGGPAAEEAANATPTPTTAGASPQPPVSVPATATGSSNGRNVQFAAPASPTTVATPSTTQTPSSTDYAAQFGSKLPPGGFVAAPCGLGGKRPAGGPCFAGISSRTAAGIAAVGARYAQQQPAATKKEHVRMQRVGPLDETEKASLNLVYIWETDRRDWVLIVEKTIREKAKARKEKEQLELGCNHPNLVRYLFHKDNRGSSSSPTAPPQSTSVFMEFVNLGSLRSLMDSWEHHDKLAKLAEVQRKYDLEQQRLARERDEQEEQRQDEAPSPDPAAEPALVHAESSSMFGLPPTPHLGAATAADGATTAGELAQKPSASFAEVNLSASRLGRYTVPIASAAAATPAAPASDDNNDNSPMVSPMGSRTTSAGFTPQHSATCIPAQGGQESLCSSFVPGSHRAPSMCERVIIARCVGKQVLHGLHYYHTVHNRYHRDVKPGNILVKDDGRVKLCDFDAYKNAAESGVTMDGTQCYLPPEIARGESMAVDGKCDVWATGIVLYEIITGRHPFEGVPAMRLVQHFTALVAALPWDDAIPHPGLRNLIRGCLTCDPKHRLSCNQASAHPFLTAPLHRLFADCSGAGATDRADIASSAAYQELLEDSRTVLPTCESSKPTRDANAEDCMKRRGIEVGEDAPELELATWRAVREAGPTHQTSSTEAERAEWRKRTDDVMKRIIHVRQHPEHKALTVILRSLGHEKKEYAKPKGDEAAIAAQASAAASSSTSSSSAPASPPGPTAAAAAQSHRHQHVSVARHPAGAASMN